jgi:hypothetical protein
MENFSTLMPLSGVVLAAPALTMTLDGLVPGHKDIAITAAQHFLYRLLSGALVFEPH